MPKLIAAINKKDLALKTKFSTSPSVYSITTCYLGLEVLLLRLNDVPCKQDPNRVGA